MEKGTEIFAILLVLMASVLKVQGWNKPSFCRSLDCPEYKILMSKKGYELREYRASNWVSTNMLGMDYKKAASANFGKLFEYISGKNSKAEKVDMTAPVINRVIPGEGPACESNFTMSFYVSSGKGPAPVPTDKDVFLNKLPAMKVYVRSFGGFAMEYPKWREEFLQLVKDINDDTKFRKDYFYTAGYDSPFTFFNRHNEVWLLASDNKIDQSLHFVPHDMNVNQ